MGTALAHMFSGWWGLYHTSLAQHQITGNIGSAVVDDLDRLGRHISDVRDMEWGRITDFNPDN